MSILQKAYQYRCYPTPEQESQLAQTFGCCRFVYNRFLRVRTDALFQEHKRIGYNETARLLTELKQQPETAFLQEVSNVCLQQSLRHLDTAFKNFFQGRAQYPTFKKKHQHQSARYMSNGFSFRDGQLRLAKQDALLDIHWSRPLPQGAIPSSVTVSKDRAGRYFVSLLVEEDDAAVLSDGEKIANPTFLRKAEMKLVVAQRRLAKKRKGSKNRAKARLKVARAHAKVADCRADFLHKTTTQIIRESQVIAAESLSVKNMASNRCLAKAIHDVGWGEWLRQLDYKARWYGRTFVQIDRWYPSSKRCHACEHVLDSLTLDVREWTCPECGIVHDRDINAARNILSAGLAQLAGADMLRLHTGDNRDFKPVEPG